jgi:hypothetical protein
VPSVSSVQCLGFTVATASPSPHLQSHVKWPNDCPCRIHCLMSLLQVYDMTPNDPPLSFSRTEFYPAGIDSD